MFSIEWNLFSSSLVKVDESITFGVYSQSDSYIVFETRIVIFIMSHFETRNGPILTDIFIFIKFREIHRKNLINLNNVSHFKT